MPLDAALVAGRYLFLALLSLFVWQVYQAMLRDLRRSARDALAPGATREPRLTVLRGRAGEPGRAFLLRGPVTLGRAADNTIVVEDPFASGHHARVWVDGGRCWVEDLESTNGTCVAGRRIAGRVELAPGAEVRIGDSVLRYEP
jgi:hypothetical protein